MRAWAAETPRVSLSVRDEGSVDGEAQHLEVENKWDRDLGIYETATWVDGQAAVRLLWTREGLWWAEGEDAEWSVATPSQIGLSGDTVDSYLETGSGIPSLADSLEPFAAYGTATPTPEGGELTIRLGQAELSADPALASQAAEHLQNQSLWLLGEASVTEVYEFAIELRMDPFGRPRVFRYRRPFSNHRRRSQLRSTVVIQRRSSPILAPRPSKQADHPLALSAPPQPLSVVPAPFVIPAPSSSFRAGGNPLPPSSTPSPSSSLSNSPSKCHGTAANSGIARSTNHGPYGRIPPATAASSLAVRLCCRRGARHSPTALPNAASGQCGHGNARPTTSHRPALAPPTT